MDCVTAFAFMGVDTIPNNPDALTIMASILSGAMERSGKILRWLEKCINK